MVKGTVCERQKKRLHDLAGREKGADQLSQSILLGGFRRTVHSTSSFGAWVGPGESGKSWCTGECLTTALSGRIIENSTICWFL